MIPRCKKWTTMEVQKLRTFLLEDGMTVRQAAEKLNRSMMSVAGKKDNLNIKVSNIRKTNSCSAEKVKPHEVSRRLQVYNKVVERDKKQFIHRDVWELFLKTVIDYKIKPTKENIELYGSLHIFSEENMFLRRKKYGENNE